MVYLSIEQLKTVLSLGKGVEQWLGYEKKEDYAILKWVSLIKEKEGVFSTSYFECFDEGSEEFVDVYEFSMLDPERPFGIVSEFPSLDQALDFTEIVYNTAIDKFVSKGMIQEEYLRYLKNHEKNSAQ